MQALHPALVSALATLLAYLAGSLSFAVIVSRAMGLNDPRSYGSGNPGATNVLRSGNKLAAAATLALDALKGYVAVLLTIVYGPAWGLGEGTQAMVGLAAFVGHLWPVFFRFEGGKGVATAAGVLLAFNPWLGLAAFLGHLWPVFFRFQGGKGVATAAGVLLAWNPWLGLATLATWLIVAFFFRYSSLASLVAAVFAPFYQLLFWDFGPLVPAMIVMSLLLVWRHSANIGKLLAGTESRLGRKAAPLPAPAQHAPGGPKHSHDAAHAARKKANQKGAKS